MTTVEANLADLDFWDSSREHQDEVFARLRAERRPVRCPTPDGVGFYVLTRHADIEEVSRNPSVFSSEPVSTSLDDLPEEVREFSGSIISLDAPRHTRLRRIVARAFTPRMVGELKQEIAAIARGIVDDLEQKGPCDFVAAVAAPMPLRLISRILGIPAELEQDMHAHTDAILASGDPDYTGPSGEDRGQVLVRKYTALQAMMEELAAERRARPAEDLITRLITANVDGECLTVQELGKFFRLLVVAGVETTRNSLAHALALLSEHPAQRELLLSGLADRLPGAVEEIVRYETPTRWMRRTVTERVAQHPDIPYRPGERVVMFYHSGNRDESVFPDADTFDITRDPNPHIGFGATGPHFCLGAHLARVEIAVLLEELLTRLPDIHVNGPGERQRSSFVNGFKTLPCAF